MSSKVAIRVDGVSKHYKLSARPAKNSNRLSAAEKDQDNRHLWALKDVSFRVYKGETLGIIGRNGAGKTTLLRVISDITEPTTGAVKVYGSLVPVLALQSGFNPEFSGRENVHLKCAIMGLSRKETNRRLGDILDFASIGEFIDRPLKTYSQGMRARLAFAVAIHVDPEILVVDEVLAVGDEAFHRKCIARIAALKEKGVTILFVSHGPALVMQLCDRAILLDHGELLIAGDPKLVVSSYQRFVYTPLEERSRVRADLLALAGGAQRSKDQDTVALAGPTAAKPPAAASSADFDPALVPQTTTQSVPQGARITEVAILDRKGRRVNELVPRETYKLILRVVFPQPAARVRFGSMVKTVEGLQVAGLLSDPSGGGLDFVEANTKLQVGLLFAASLATGTYFVDVEVRGELDGREMDLHRIIDATAFRVASDQERPITGLADISARPFCDISPMLPKRQAASGNS